MEVISPSGPVWLIFLLPLIAFAVIFLLIKPLNKPRLASFISIGAVLGSLALSTWLLFSLLASPEHELTVPSLNWLVVGGAINIQFGLILDSLTVVML
ncbi:MAG: hypothetical protein KAI14_00485, partial [Dehalococcoidales bacterium]|nr:hypothetical protein [Dehalococcoidales bacterium]